MGLKSDPVIGLAILGMGVTRALVHISGKRELLRDKLTISWRAGITASPIVLSISPLYHPPLGPEWRSMLIFVKCPTAQQA